MEKAKEKGAGSNQERPSGSVVAPPASQPGAAVKTAKTMRAPETHIPSAEGFVPPDDLKRIFDFTIDIIDKQYRSYVWNDGKVQALVTIDTALIAGILLILQIFNHVGVPAFILLACSFVSLMISFVICLLHAIPRLNAGIGNEENLRTMVGITRFRKE